MATKTLDQIMAEADPLFAPSRSLIQQQQAALPGQFEADQKGLEATAARANENIITGARRRGLGFSGIPLGEQAQYSATEFMPAVARLKQGQLSQQMSLQEALSQLDRDHRGYAQGIYQSELDREQQERQFQQQLAAQRQAASAAVARPTLGTQNRATAPGSSNLLSMPGVVMNDAKRGGAGGFTFKGMDGKNLTVENWAGQNGQDIGDVLFTLAQSGDPYAASAYQSILSNKGVIDDNVKSRFQGIFNPLGLTGLPGLAMMTARGVR